MVMAGLSSSSRGSTGEARLRFDSEETESWSFKEWELYEVVEDRWRVGLNLEDRDEGRDASESRKDMPGEDRTLPWN